MATSTLIVDIQEDGTIKTNASQMIGTEEELLKDLEALATEVGGELVVEKHVGGNHVHTHGGVEHHHKVGSK